MSRNQHRPVRCGACGKKGAYGTGYGDYPSVRCRYCGASMAFLRWHQPPPYDGPVWPGNLEAAAAMMRPKPPAEKENTNG